MSYAPVPPLHVRHTMAEAFKRHAAADPNPFNNDADEVVYEMILEGLMVFTPPDILQLTELSRDAAGSA